MKIKEGFILRNVAKEHVVMPVGRASLLLNGLIKLNDSGAMLWNLLKEEADQETLVAALEKEYGISNEQAKADVEAFLAPLIKVGCVE